MESDEVSLLFAGIRFSVIMISQIRIKSKWNLLVDDSTDDEMLVVVSLIQDVNYDLSLSLVDDIKLVKIIKFNYNYNIKVMETKI